MSLLILGLSAAVHVSVVEVFYWARIRQVIGLARSDLFAFGLPLLGATAVYFLVLRARLASLLGSTRSALLSAILLATVVQTIALTIAFNLWGT